MFFILTDQVGVYLGLTLTNHLLGMVVCLFIGFCIGQSHVYGWALCAESPHAFVLKNCMFFDKLSLSSIISMDTYINRENEMSLGQLIRELSKID